MSSVEKSKQRSQGKGRENRKKPKLIKYRSSLIYIMITVCFSVAANDMIYGTITPIMPFVISAMQQGKPFNTSAVTLNHDSTIDSTTEASTVTGTLLAMFFIAFAIGSPVFGYICDYYKTMQRRFFSILVVCIQMGSLFLFIFATEFWMFALARALQGFATGGISTIGYVIVADTFPPKVLGTRVGIVSMCFMAGLSAGAPIGALFHRYGYKVPFSFSIAVVGIELLLYLGLVERRNNPDEWFESYKENGNSIPSINHGSNEHKNGRHNDPEKHIEGINNSNHGISDKHATKKGDNNVLSSNTRHSIEQPHTEDPNQNPEATPINASPSQLSSSIAQSRSMTSHCDSELDTNITMVQLLCSPRIWTTMTVSFCSGWAVIGFEPTLPAYLNIQWGYNPSQIGLLLVIQLIPSAIASVIAGRIYDRIGGKLLCFSALLLDGASVALSGIPNRNTSVVPLIVTTSANEFFASMYRAAMMVEAMYATKALKSGNESTTDNDDDNDDDTDGGIARAYGLANMSFAIGCSLSPLLSGYLYNRLNFLMMCIIISCFLFFAAPFSLLFLGNKQNNSLSSLKKMFLSICSTGR